MGDFKPVNQPIAPASADPGEEFPFLHTITVVDRVVSVDKPELVQNNIRTETVTLNLDSEWDGLSCIINIGNDDTPVSLIWSGQPVIIPAELMTDIGTLNVSVVGYGEGGTVRAVTKKADAMFVVAASGYVEDDNPVPDPTTILGQLTEAADRANQAAQNAEDSTIDKVSVTMLPTGSGASGSVADKTLSLRIPNAPRGPQGPKGDPGDLTTVAHDDTLTGDGTTGTPLGAAVGSALNQGVTASVQDVDFNEYTSPGIYGINSDGSQNSPSGMDQSIRVALFVSRCGYNARDGVVLQTLFVRNVYKDDVGIYMRSLRSGTWDEWKQMASMSDIPSLSNYVPLSTYQALEAKVQALEAKTTYKPTIANGTDLHTLFEAPGTYRKMWGTTVVNAPTSTANDKRSAYLIAVVGVGNGGYMRIDPITGISDSYYLRKSNGVISSWYKITATEVTA